MENNKDDEVGEKRKRGRPPNSEKVRKRAGRHRRMSATKAKQLQRAHQANCRHEKANEAKKRRSERIFDVKKNENPQFWKSYSCPERQGHHLSQDQIDMAMRVVYKMNEAKEPAVMERASSFLGIGISKLYELWRKFVETGEVPHSLRGRKRQVRIKLVSMEWMKPIQEEMERIRLEENRAVEAPDILKWLKEKYDITITMSQLRYRLDKMGFVFSKAGKLTTKKEDPRYRKLRQDYLKRRHEYNKLIKDSNNRYYLLKQHGIDLNRMKEIVYIYLDESYVNWY
jgi:transposase